MKRHGEPERLRTDFKTLWSRQKAEFIRILIQCSCKVATCYPAQVLSLNSKFMLFKILLRNRTSEIERERERERGTLVHYFRTSDSVHVKIPLFRLCISYIIVSKQTNRLYNSTFNEHAILLIKVSFNSNTFSHSWIININTIANFFERILIEGMLLPMIIEFFNQFHFTFDYELIIDYQKLLIEFKERV